MSGSTSRPRPGWPAKSPEKALKEALGFSPKGDVRPIGGLPHQEGKAKRVFYKKAGEG